MVLSLFSPYPNLYSFGNMPSKNKYYPVLKQLNYNGALEYHKNPIKHLTISKLNFFSEFNSHFLNNQCPLPTAYHVTGHTHIPTISHSLGTIGTKVVHISSGIQVRGGMPGQPKP